jgi:excisionase family DNA binding protein
MARLTKAEAARQMGISRTTLYKLIHAGTLSAHPDGTIDTAELVRAVSTLTPPVQREHFTPVQREHFTPVQREHLNVHTVRQGVHDMDSEIIDDEHYDRSPSVHREHREQVFTERQLTSTYRELVDTLREQLQAAREREKDYQARIAWLEQHVDQIQQRYDRLLDAPRPAPPPAPPASSPTRPHSTPLPAAWQGILAHMRAQGQPMRPQEVQQALGLATTPRHMMARMCERGLLRRVAPGVYAVPE